MSALGRDGVLIWRIIISGFRWPLFVRNTSSKSQQLNGWHFAPAFHSGAEADAVPPGHVQTDVASKQVQKTHRPVTWLSRTKPRASPSNELVEGRPISITAWSVTQRIPAAHGRERSRHLGCWISRMICWCLMILFSAGWK
jgi:hypothetical protein